MFTKRMTPNPLFWVLMLLTVLLLQACGTPQYTTRETPVVTVEPPVRETAVMIVPDRVLDECDPLAVPPGKNASQVLDTMLQNHGIHGSCMFKNDLKADYLIAADETGAKVRIYQRGGVGDEVDKESVQVGTKQ